MSKSKISIHCSSFKSCCGEATQLKFERWVETCTALVSYHALRTWFTFYNQNRQSTLLKELIRNKTTDKMLRGRE